MRKRGVQINRINLVVEMTKKNLATIDLSELSGVSKTTLSYIRSGKSCSKETADKIAKALNVPLETLLTTDSI